MVINFLINNKPKVCWPGIDLVAGMQSLFPVFGSFEGKYGSLSGMGIGKHSGCTVSLESQERQFNIPSFIKPEKKIKDYLSI